MEAFLGTPKKDEKTVDVWIDGSCEPINPNGTACGAYVIKVNDTLVEKTGKVIGSGEGMTNNVAEFQALIFALQKLKQLNLSREYIKIKSDSELLVGAINRKCQIKDHKLQPLFRTAKDLLRGIHYQIEWIPREKNEEADALTHAAYSRSI
jgi:ribonuclease HI